MNSMMRMNTMVRAGSTAAIAVLLWAGCTEHPVTLGPMVTLAEMGASNPTVAVAPGSDTAYVAWVEGAEGSTGNVRLATVVGGSATGAPVRVNDIDQDAAPHLQAPAQVAAGPGGHVYVAWQNNTIIEGRRFPASDLRLARSEDGGRTFAPAITVNDDAGGQPASHTFHNLLVAPDGSVVVSWLDGRESANAESGGPETRTDGTVAHAEMSHSDMAMSDGSSSSVRVAVSHNGGESFEPGIVVDTETCPCCRTALAAAPDGTLFVAWRKIFEGDVRDVVVARSTDGGRTWKAPVKVADDGWVFPGCPHAGPALTVDAAGGLHVAWYTGRDSGAGMYHAVSSNGGRTFASAAPLLAGGWVPPSQVALAPDGHDGAWVAWEDRREEAPSFLLSNARAGNAQAGDPVVTPGSNPAIAPLNGGAVVAWLEGDAVRFRGVTPS